MERPSVVAPICLVIGALLGLAGTFAPSPALRGEYGHHAHRHAAALFLQYRADDVNDGVG